MTKSITLKFTKLAILAIVGVVLMFLMATNTFAQSSTPATSPAPEAAADLKFPIEDLGSCADMGACMSFCEDPVNYNSCADYAKKNGFYKDDPAAYADKELVENAKNELGCDSKESCMSFCSQPGNHEACDSWAKRNDIPGGYTEDPASPEIIEEAKKELGCDSAESCQVYCSLDVNGSSCTSFAGKVGIVGGTVKEGPGGCQSEETCGAFCSDPNNFSQCAPFAPGGKADFKGPGGCINEDTCQNYCEQNPDQCRSYTPGTNGVYVPVECPEGESQGPGGMCTATANISQAASCVGSDKFWNGETCQDQAPIGVSTDIASAYFEPRSDMGNCQTPGECYDYCKENPNQCQKFDSNSERPSEGYNPYVYYTPGTEVKIEPVKSMGNCDSPAACYDYCKENADSCQGFNPEAPRPPEIYIPETYYTPPTDSVYVTPPVTGFYTTPIYYTPPTGSTYTTPQYYTPGMYSTPSYNTPIAGSNYVTPNYYTPWNNYSTPTGEYPTPAYTTPNYYTPPAGSRYSTPYYYTPPSYYTPHYYTPGEGSRYTTPADYVTPPPYTTPQYYTPYTGVGYTTPVYYTPPTYNTPIYYTPPVGSEYTSPNYYTPPVVYTTPRYYTPGTYPTPPTYSTPPAYTTPNYPTPPAGSNYTTPQYYTPVNYTTPNYYTPPTYITPMYYTPYTTPTYPTPPAGSDYTTPQYSTPQTISYFSPPYYPTPSSSGTGGYPTPTTNYYTPEGSYPTPYYSPGGTYYATPSTSSYPTPTYGTPTYNTPTYQTPSAYTTPAYGTPTYETPSYNSPSYGTPSYDTPSYNTPSYGTPSEGGQTQGVSIQKNLLQQLWGLISGK